MILFGIGLTGIGILIIIPLIVLYTDFMLSLRFGQSIFLRLALAISLWMATCLIQGAGKIYQIHINTLFLRYQTGLISEMTRHIRSRNARLEQNANIKYWLSQNVYLFLFVILPMISGIIGICDFNIWGIGKYLKYYPFILNCWWSLSFANSMIKRGLGPRFRLPRMSINISGEIVLIFCLIISFGATLILWFAPYLNPVRFIKYAATSTGVAALGLDNRHSV